MGPGEGWGWGWGSLQVPLLLIACAAAFTLASLGVLWTADAVFVVQPTLKCTQRIVAQEVWGEVTVLEAWEVWEVGVTLWQLG